MFLLVFDVLVLYTSFCARCFCVPSEVQSLVLGAFDDMFQDVRNLDVGDVVFVGLHEIPCIDHVLVPGLPRSTFQKATIYPPHP